VKISLVIPCTPDHFLTLAGEEILEKFLKVGV
jgi:hypothetical protein